MASTKVKDLRPGTKTATGRTILSVDPPKLQYGELTCHVVTQDDKGKVRHHYWKPNTTFFHN